MEKLFAGPYFQIVLGAIVGIGVITLGVALAVFKFFIPSLGKAFLSPVVPNSNPQEQIATIIKPEFCTACQAEHERSLENQKKINVLFNRTGDMTKSLNELCVDTAVLKNGNEAILKAVTRLENAK